MKKCVICGKVFGVRGRTRACSYKCKKIRAKAQSAGCFRDKRKLRAFVKQYDQPLKCVICGKKFKRRGRKITCSAKCRHIRYMRYNAAAIRKQDSIRNKRYRAANRKKIRAYYRKYYAAHPKWARERNARYYAANKKKLRIKRLRYHAANRKKYLAQRARFRLKHREQILAYASRYHAKNRKKILAKAAIYRAANLEKIRAGNRWWYYAAKQRKELARKGQYRAPKRLLKVQANRSARAASDLRK